MAFKLEKLQKFGFEFLTIFISIFAAFALDNWNDNRKDRLTEISILQELENGLQQDIKDIEVNEFGHKSGIQAASFFTDIVQNKKPPLDSFIFHYTALLRGFLTQQNISGYETLKSKGLDIIHQDALRSEIIALYENNYNTLRKLEEEYTETQFYTLYVEQIDDCILPYVILLPNGQPNSIRLPLSLSMNQKQKLLSSLWKIQANRKFVLSCYAETKSKIKQLQEHIRENLKKS